MTLRFAVGILLALASVGDTFARTPPTCTLSLAPPAGPGGTVVAATAVVTPGTSPPSTGLAVSLDGSSLGLGAMALLDDGIGPDAFANDNIFSGVLTVPVLTPNGSYALPSTVSDAQARSNSCSASFNVGASPGSQPIASDGFAYVPAGGILQSYLPGGAGFSGSWYESGGNWITQAPTMSYTDGVRNLVTSPGRIHTANAEARRNLYLPGGPIGNNTGTVWVSMLLRQTSGGTANNFGGLTLPTGPGTGLFVGKPYNRAVWGIENGPGTTLLTSIPVSTAAFLVVRIDFQPGADNVYMWVNPSLSVAPNPGTANIAAPAYGNFENIRILLLHAGGAPLFMEADEIRLGYTFADVAPYARPSNDDCAGALPAFLGLNAFDNSIATTSSPVAGCGNLGSDTWFQFTPPTTGRYTIETCGNANYDTALAVYDSCGGTELECNDDWCGLQSRVVFCGVAGSTVYVRVGGFNGELGYGAFFITSGDPNDPGETIATAALSMGANPITGVIGDGCGTDNDADVYIISITDPSNFVATTVGGASFDTQLFLFDAAGNGITSNDDNPSGGLQSTITGAFVPGPGLYYLAISSYDKDPIDSGAAALWLDTPFNVERTPDGPGGANPWAGFDSTSTTGGPYSIFLVGTTNPVKANKCMTGWIGMDDVCPTNAVGGQEIYDYTKGTTTSGAMLSSPVPYSEAHQFVDNSLHFGLKPGGLGQPPQVADTYLDYRIGAKNQFAITSGTAGGFTAMAWINLDASSTTDVTLIDLLGNATGGVRLFLADDVNSSDMLLRAEVKMSSGASRLYPTTTPNLTVTPGHWTLVSIRVTWGTTASSGTVTLEVGDSTATTPVRNTTGSQPVGTCTNANLVGRLGARSGSITPAQYYKGFFDEFQTYSCSLSDSEVTAIQSAGSAGVAKDKVFAPWETGSQAETNIVDVPGVLIVDRQGQPADPLPNYLLSYSPTPSGGAGAYCNTTPFPVATFTPVTAVLPSVPRGITPFTLHIDTDPVRFIGHSCFNVYATNMLTGTSTAAMGSIVDHPIWWADLDPLNPNNIGHPSPGPNTPGFKEVAIGTPTTWHFRISNSSSMPRSIQYKVAAMSADMSMAPVPVTLSLGAGVLPGLCPSSGGSGAPVCGSITVPANTTVNLPVVTATIVAGPGTEDIFEIVLYADIDSSGTLTSNEDLASAGMIALLMPPPVTPPCGCHGPCVSDVDDGSGTGTPDGGVTIDDLLYYLNIFEAGAPCADNDDGSGTGEPDGGVTIDDLLYFLTRFEAGC